MPGRITLSRTVKNVTDSSNIWNVSAKTAQADWTIDIPSSLDVLPGQTKSVDITIDGRRVRLGESRHGDVLLDNGITSVHIPITFVRGQGVVLLTKGCEPRDLRLGDITTCTIEIENTATQAVHFNLMDHIPAGLQLLSTSVDGAGVLDAQTIGFQRTLRPAKTTQLQLQEEPAPYGFVSLGELGVDPLPSPLDPDDGGLIISQFDFIFNRQHYIEVLWSVNGTIEVGAVSGEASQANNTIMPDAASPHNLLAPWWSDWDLTSGGNWYIATINDRYDVLSWEHVQQFGDPATTASFQVWIEIGTDRIWFTYGDFTGALSDGTIGVENANGTVGSTFYFGETGVGQTPTTDLLVISTPGARGGRHAITFSMRAIEVGPWESCSDMTADLVQGITSACESGRIE